MRPAVPWGQFLKGTGSCVFTPSCSVHSWCQRAKTMCLLRRYLVEPFLQWPGGLPFSPAQQDRGGGSCDHNFCGAASAQSGHYLQLGPLECHQEQSLSAEQQHLVFPKYPSPFSIRDCPVFIPYMFLQCSPFCTPSGNKEIQLITFSGLWRKQNWGQSDPWTTASVVIWFGISATVWNPKPEHGKGSFSNYVAL